MTYRGPARPIRGRFAPSPSGRMHLGNALSALLAWLSVRSAGGVMVLRLEDLDPVRCRPEFARQVEEDLRWLGLDWDEGGLAAGPQWSQSGRRDLYEAQLTRLEAMGLTYPCFCTRGDLHAASAPHASDGTPLYSGACRNLTAEQRAERAKSRHPSIRIQTPDRDISFVDGNLGPFSQNLARDCGDFILRRSDGVHAYQLAVVTDDGDMRITQVVRGRDLLNSTPRQLWLQELLDLPHPDYFHIPLLLSPGGRRLSKRDSDLDLGALRAAGVTPEAIVGRLAFWAELTPTPAPVRASELIPHFSWAHVKKEDITIPRLDRPLF